MNYRIASILFGIAILLAGASDGLAQTRVYAQVNSQTSIYPGQTFTYSVVVEGGNQPEKIDMSPLARFNPQSLGSNSATQIINSQVTVSVSQNYAIVAGQPGTMVLPGVKVVVDGKTYTTNSVEVTVSKTGTTDRMSVEFLVSSTSAYVGQPLTMIVNWTFTAQVRNASFDVPAFQTDDFYIEDAPQAVRANGQQAMIHNVPVFVTQEQRSVRGMQGAVVSFTKVLIPKRPGKIALDPVSVSADMAVGTVRTGDFFQPYTTKYDRFTVKSEPVELNVQALPDTGKPAGFYGLVGNYTISTSATPTQVSVGDPITLTIRIGGNPYLKPVQWPDLENLPGLGDRFKIPSEKASPVIENGQKVFTQTIRADSDDVAEIPPIALSYFDPTTGGYVVAKSRPIPLDVAPSKVLTHADVEGAAPTAVSRQVQALREGFSANYYSSDALVNQSFSVLSAATHPLNMIFWLAPFAAFVVSAGFKLSTRTNPHAIAAKRRRQASRIAIHKLHAAASADPKEKHDRIASAMKGYLGDRFDRIAGSLTADDCYNVAMEATRDEALATRFKEHIANLEAARYAPLVSKASTDEIEEAVALIRQVEEGAKE